MPAHGPLRRGPRRWGRLAAVTTCVSALVLSACSDDPDPQPTGQSPQPSTTQIQAAPGSPEEAAEKLAAQLRRCTYGIPTSGASVAEAKAAVQEACEVLQGKPAIKVVSVENFGDASHAELSVTWKVPGVEKRWNFPVQIDFDKEQAGWTLRWTPSLIAAGWVPGEKLAVRTGAAERGDVIGDAGRVLVTKRRVFRVGIDKPQVHSSKQRASAQALGKLVEIDAEAYARKVRGYGAQAFVDAIVLRESDPLLDKVRASGIGGLLLIPAEMELGPSTGFAPEVLGSVQDASAEDLANNPELTAGATLGKGGLQEAYDKELRGESGTRVISYAESGGEPTVLFDAPASPGKNLRTTLNAVYQTEAERLLKDVKEPASIVVMRPSSGYVLAMANSEGTNGYNSAALGQYAPGSTFKIATALALLRTGRTSGDLVECPTTLTVDGRSFKNNPYYDPAATGQVSLRTAFAHSCNTTFVKASEDIKPGDFAAAAIDLGLTSAPKLGIDNFLANIPDDSVGTEHAATMIGQGRLQTSPLGIATMTASVAAMTRVKPVLVLGLDEPKAEKPGASGRIAPGATAAAKLTEPEAGELQSLMRAVVEEGSGDFLADIPGPPVLAKTGTAEAGADSNRLDAWMTAIQGDLVVTVLVEGGGYGSQAAGPLTEDFLRAIN